MRNLKYPLVTYSVVVTCVVVYLLQLISHNKIDYSLFFIPERIIDNFEVWRLFTPAIMHFGVMHILFNVMIFNFFGSMIERDYGPSKLLLMFFGFSAVSNFFQYLFTQNYLFGGLSGVVSGVVGYSMIISVIPGVDSRFKMAVGLCLINIVFNIYEYFAQSHVAFAAHATGLIVGIACGVFEYNLIMHRMGRKFSAKDIVNGIINTLRNR